MVGERGDTGGMAIAISQPGWPVTISIYSTDFYTGAYVLTGH